MGRRVRSKRVIEDRERRIRSVGKESVAMATEGDTHRVNWASPPHLNSNLDMGQRQTGREEGLVSSEDNL